MDRSVYWRLFRFAGTLLLSAAAGCGGAATYSVEGKVAYKNGTPMLGGGQVLFEPVDKNSKISARGIIQEDGSFRMGTFGDADGVPEGTYRVAIQPAPPRNINRPPPGWPPIHKKYMNYAKSNLEYTVKSGTNEFNIEVEK